MLVESDEKLQRIKKIDEIMASNQMQEMLENIATGLLRPDFPVVSLAKLNIAVRDEIIQRNLIDPEDLKEIVYSLIR